MVSAATSNRGSPGDDSSHTTYSHSPDTPPRDSDATAPGGDELFPTHCDGDLPPASERFKLDREIARGAMGVVYSGRDSLFDREIAVKFLLERHLGNPGLRCRFAEEARITAHLAHPGIPPVYETGELSGGRPFYSMRLMDGRSLASMLADRVDTCEDSSLYLKVFEKVCETMAYAHEAGVIHRDLKPGNILVGSFGRVKVMDWGLAKALPHCSFFIDSGPQEKHDGEAADESSLTCFGWALGTPSYMSPEQAHGHPEFFDERTDVFCLGGILCIILTGKPPYIGTNTAAILRQARAVNLAGAYERLDSCRGDPELVALAKRCLAPNPARRPRNAGRVYEELSEHLDYDLRRAERDLVSFFELSLDLFCIAGADGYFRRINSNFSRVLGHTSEALLARPFLDFVHPDDCDRTHAEVLKVLSGSPCVHFLNRYRNTSGEYHWFEWTAKAIPGEGMMFAVARDVTDRVRLEDQLRSLEGR